MRLSFSFRTSHGHMVGSASCGMVDGQALMAMTDQIAEGGYPAFSCTPTGVGGEFEANVSFANSRYKVGREKKMERFVETLRNLGIDAEAYEHELGLDPHEYDDL